MTGTSKKRSGDFGPPPSTRIKKGKTRESSVFLTVEEISSTSSTVRHSSPAGNNQLIWPKPDELWEVFGDANSTQVLKGVANMEDYQLAARYFCGRHQLLIRGINMDELTAIARATMPPFYSNISKAEQGTMADVLEAAWDWAETQTIIRLKTYAISWVTTPVGAKYKANYESSL